MSVAAELAGVPGRLVPASVADLGRYVASVRPELRCTPAAAESMVYLFDPPGLCAAAAWFWQDARDGAIAVFPEWAGEKYGYGAAAPDARPPGGDPAVAERP